jgi:DNA-binding response OmpR family regulator
MSEAGNILLVDDEPGMLRYIRTLLEVDNYKVETASTGEEALQRIEKGLAPDLVLLDVLMPGIDGLETLEQLRQMRPGVKVVMLSCVNDTRKVVQAMRLGAQDYLTKPFSLAELLARVRVRLRGEAHLANEVLKAGDLVLDVGRLEANIGHGAVALTRLEFLLLRELMEHAGQSVGKGKLLATVWGYDFDPGSNVVDVCVRRLRSKLGFDLIKTVRGEGYRLAS